jgi:hypothetical protein
VRLLGGQRWGCISVGVLVFKGKVSSRMGTLNLYRLASHLKGTQCTSTGLGSGLGFHFARYRFSASTGVLHSTCAQLQSV